MEELDFTGERMIPEACAGTALFLEHVTRYFLAARLARGKRVLDAGTGVGYGAAILADAGAKQVIGIDIDRAAIAYASKRYAGPRVTFRVDDVTLLGTVPDASVDLCVCFETIEHVDAAAAVVSQAARVLVADGVFLCSTPNWEVSRCQNPFHKREYRSDELLELLRRVFPFVEILGQRTLFANRIAALRNESPGTGGVPDEVRVGASDVSAPVPYFVAIASHSAIGCPAALVNLGVASDTEMLHQHIQRIEGGVAERDGRLAALDQERERQVVEIGRLEAERTDLTHRTEVLHQRLAEVAKELERQMPEIGRLEAEGEKKNRYIQNLEGGVAERDAKIRDLDMTIRRREMVFALRIVHGMIRVNRLLGRLPTRLLRGLRHAFRQARVRSPRVLAGADGPLFSIVIPIRDHFEFLKPAIESALGQTWGNYECILYDDASTDPRVRPLLESYRSHPRARVFFGDKNLGISGATNRGVVAAEGRFVAFLDCDDLLEGNALERVATYLERDSAADFVYTNRADIDERDRIVERWDFVNRSLGSPDQELLTGMFASHLKVIRRDALRRVGLFRGEFDSVQDYDMALRLSEVCRFGFLRESLYRHRVHPGQTTQRDSERQQVLSERARSRAILRRRLAAGDCQKLVSIVVLSLNRPEDTEICLEAIARHTHLPHEVILIDNGSSRETIARLRAFVAGRSGVTLHELPENTGCGGGRNLGARWAKGDYVVMLDNDIEVRSGWLAHLLTEMEADPDLAACCCRVVFPDGVVQFNGGRTTYGLQRVRFDLLDTGRREEDLDTLHVLDCDWIPGGATIFRKPLLDANPYDTGLAGAYEDNDWSITMRRAGYRLRNCPLATVTHHHFNYSMKAQRDTLYRSQRYGRERLEATLLHFHAKHGIFIEEEDLYRSLGYTGSEHFIDAVLASGRSRG